MKLQITFLFFSLFLIGCTSSRPIWIDETPKGYENDYFVGVGASTNSIADAHTHAVVNAVKQIAEKEKIIIDSSKLQLITKSVENFSNGQSSLNKEETFEQQISIQIPQLSINNFVEAERYYESDVSMCTFWSLAKIPKKNNIEEPPTKFSPVWRSALIPGWGQYYKGQQIKGFFFIGAEVLLIPSGIIFNNLGVDAESDKFSSRTQAVRDYYNDQSKLFYNVSLGCFIAAGALYVYNVVDAISSDWKIYATNDVPQLRWNEKLQTAEVQMTFHF